MDGTTTNIRGLEIYPNFLSESECRFLYKNALNENLDTPLRDGVNLCRYGWSWTGCFKNEQWCDPPEWLISGTNKVVNYFPEINVYEIMKYNTDYKLPYHIDTTELGTHIGSLCISGKSRLWIRDGKTQDETRYDINAGDLYIMSDYARIWCSHSMQSIGQRWNILFRNIDTTIFDFMRGINS